MKKSDLSAAKRELLSKWLEGNISDDTSAIQKRRNVNEIKISFTQQRQLFLELLRPGTAVNNLSIGIELNGSLDFAALQKSANVILARHEILRLKFLLNHGLPSAEILETATVKISYIDLSNQNSTSALQLAQEIAAQPFDLTVAPLVRLRLFKVAGDRHFLVVVIHHTIADGWSLGIFLKELTTTYQSISKGNYTVLPELPIQYVDFAEWQFNRVRENRFDQDLEFWKSQLKGDLPVLELPSDRRRPAQQTFSGGTHRFIIARKTIQRLETIGQVNDATLFMVLMTAYVTFLQRYSNQEDIIVGTPTAGRNLPELADLIGPFINTLALRIDVSGNPTFLELLGRVRLRALAAYSHQELPFEKIVEELNPRRDLSHSPVFQTVFNLRNAPLPNLSGHGLEMQLFEIPRSVSEMDLTLMIAFSEENYHAIVEYNRDLFDKTTIERMFVQFEALLSEIIDNPGTLIADLHLGSNPLLLRAAPHHRNVAYPHEKRMHQLFEEHASSTPETMAVGFGDTSLSYLELNTRASAIAQTLESKGIKPNDKVGVCMSRSREIPEILLGIHKAGCVYVPIHPSSPSARIQFIVRDAGIRMILSNMNIEVPGIDVLSPRDVGPVVPGSYNSNCAFHADNDLAYIIYTSGSTGNPKGVMIPHRALTNFLWSMKDRPGLTSNDVLLSVTSITFDIAALELFLPLITGAKVVIASDDMISNPAKLVAAIEKDQVTIMQATPAMWQMVIDSGWRGNPRLKALCGGDVLTSRLAERLIPLASELWNMYGPTETTIWSTVGRIVSSSGISAGHPINNTEAFILDSNLAPVPVGVYGELYLGGHGLAVGYLNNPELTKHKFIETAGKQSLPARLFKTGDKARFLTDYSIELLGRLDDQVKIYGHRIDLNEVQSAILEHPLVTGAVVVSKSNDKDKKTLIGYYVVKGDFKLPQDELKRFVKDKLPGYMIPSAFVLLEGLPLTPNGKVDRKALPEPPNLSNELNYAPPQTNLEKVLVGIWQSSLGVEQIGIHDNFFDLGGASIQSVQIITAAANSGYQFKPEDLFECQTIFELARKYDAMKN